MITIDNVSQHSTPAFGPHTYEIKVNDDLISEFIHLRQPRDLVKCLRDAADAVEKIERLENLVLKIR